MTRTAKIVRKQDVRGGFATIAGTRISVTDIVRYYRLYLPDLAARVTGPPDPNIGCMIPISTIAQEIRAHLPHLSPDHVGAALRYWHEHEDEIERELALEEAAAREVRERYSQPA